MNVNQFEKSVENSAILKTLKMDAPPVYISMHKKRWLSRNDLADFTIKQTIQPWGNKAKNIHMNIEEWWVPPWLLSLL